MMLFHEAMQELDQIIHVCQLDLYTREVILLLLFIISIICYY